MKRRVNIITAALVAAGLSAPSWSDDDTTRFESSGFLKSLDAFVAEQMAKQRAGSELSGADHLKELELSLRSNTPNTKNAFRLSDSRELRGLGSKPIDEIPSFSSLLAPTGQLKGSVGFEELAANSRVNLSFGKKKGGDESKRFNFSLQSGYRISGESTPAPSAFTNSGLADREYNLGVTLGYSGFGVDASMTRQTSVFKPEAYGFDVGLSYQTTSFAARLSMSEYHEGADLYGIENEVRSIVSVELGARYKLTNNIGLNGGVRYYDYGDQWLVDASAGENSKMIFLGGQLKF
jgi:opacity protein-like surface antigen